MSDDVVIQQTGKVAFVDDASAQFAGGWSNVQNVIGRAHHLGVVFDDEHGVADVAQVLQQTNQTIVVSRMQTDRRFVEHVERAHEGRAEIGCELNTLRFAARKRRSKPIERQVVETDFHEKTQPAADFEQDSFGNGCLFSREFQGIEKLSRVFDR